VKVYNLIDHLEKTANPLLAANWDQSGIQVAGNISKIHKIALTLDPHPEIIEQALKWGADFIITHHPLTLNPRLPGKLDKYNQALRLIFKQDIWLYTAHTSLDVQTFGPVSWLANIFDLYNIQPIEDLVDDQQIALNVSLTKSTCGYGLIGDLPETSSWEQIQATLRTTLLLDWVCVGKKPEKITKVAYCPGSGMSLAPKAFELGAQIFISGDLKYHLAQELEDLGLTLDVGHFILEDKMMQEWARILTEELSSTNNVSVKFFKGHNPFWFSYSKT